jgi:hypothetical protein
MASPIQVRSRSPGDDRSAWYDAPGDAVASQPRYYTVDSVPVMVLEREGRHEAYVYEDLTGNFKNDASYLKLVDVTSGRHIVELASSRFEEVLAECRVKLVHRLCQKMCTSKGSAAELLELFGDGHTPPLPLSAEKMEIKPDELAFATVVVRMTPGVLKRWQIEQELGAGVEQERLKEFFPHRFRYPVVVPGAKYICALYVSTPHTEGGIDANVITLAFNQEPNRS